MPSNSEPTWGRGLGWTLAVMGPVVAAGFGVLLGSVIQPHVLPPFLLAIAAAAVVGGLGPGIVAAVLSAVAVNYWFFAPPERFGFASQSDLVAQLVFWASSLLTASVCAWSRAWRQRAESEASALTAEAQAHRAEMARMQLALDRAALEEAMREQSARELAERERAAVEAAVRDQMERERAALAAIVPERTGLVADDDADGRQMACHALESAGFRWLSACDGTEALELLDRYDFPIALAVIEAALPDMTGQLLADRLRARHPGIAVLYTSLSLAEELVAHGLLQPGEVLVRKPFTADGLLRVVRAMIDQAPSSEGAGTLSVSRGER